MKSFRLNLQAAMAASALLLAAAPAMADGALHPRNLAIPPLNPIHKVTPERYALPNGIVVYLLEDHDLPIVSGTAYFKASSAYEPAAKAGLAGITGSTMRRGGTAAHAGDWLDDHLGSIAASLGTGIGQDNASASFRCLTENTSEVVGLFGDMLRNPAFPEDKIELAKVGLRRSIASRNDDMFGMIGRVARKTIYGKDSPWASEPEYATVEAVTRADCIRFYKLSFSPDRMILAIYGDFHSEDMKKLVASALGDWKPTGVALPPLPPAATPRDKRVVYAQKDDVTQTGAIIAIPGSRADDPDYPAMTVLENALGGGFQSRLFNHIRTERGLAYAAGANAGVDFARPGVFLAYTLTKSESTMVATKLMREDVEKITREPFTDEEIKVARETALNSFVFEFEKPDQTLFRSAYYELNGYPQDFLQKYQAGLQAVTPASVLAAAQRKIKPENFQVLLIGKEKDFDAPLTSLGMPVERMDVSIPPPASKVKTGEATPQSLAKGRQWLKKAADLAGGATAWAAVKTVHMEEDANLSIQGQSLKIGSRISWDFSGKRLAVQQLPFGEMSSGFDGTTAWVQSPQGTKDQPDGAKSFHEEWTRSLFNLFGHGDKLSVQALADPRAVDGVSYNVAAVASDDVKDWLLYFNPAGQLARMEFQGKGPQGPALETVVYSNWKTLGPLKYPYSQTVLLDGQKFLESSLLTAKVNEVYKAEMFKKPVK